MRYADPLAQAEIDRLTRLTDQLDTERLRLLGEMSKAGAHIDAVAALHRPAEPSAWAPHDDCCQEDGDTWPCATVRAIGAEQ